MSTTKSNGNPNLRSIMQAALTTFLVYLSINLVALGWAVLITDFSGPLSVELKNLTLTIDGRIVGLTWNDTLTRIILMALFLGLIIGDMLRGKASLRRPDADAGKASTE
jgi:hypothetical protein